MRDRDRIIKNDDPLTEAIKQLEVERDVVLRRDAHVALIDARSLLDSANTTPAQRPRGDEAEVENGSAKRKEPACPVRVLGVVGRAHSVSGLTIRAEIEEARIGDLVQLDGCEGLLYAEVASLTERSATLLPLGETLGIGTDTEVRLCEHRLAVPVGRTLIGRVLNGLGRPIDDGPVIETNSEAMWPITRSAPHPMHRARISERLPIGIRAIDALTTIGCGQRIGVFAGSGVGKSLLLGQIARSADVDVVVIALVGERGREVRSFLEDALGEDGRKRSVVVVATSDEPPMVRLKSAFTATAIAEWFREQGKNVLLLMDSLTRFARAQRDAGLAIGEIPARHGYPASVFTALPALLERAGNSRVGNITAIYTVLVPAGDLNEPISDEVRGLLDGHIVLSRRIAERAHWPAIDVLASLSRSMDRLTSQEHRLAANRFRRILATYESKRDLITLGAYKIGSDPQVDEAIDLVDDFEGFLRQSLEESTPFDETLEGLMRLVS